MTKLILQYTFFDELQTFIENQIENSYHCPSFIETFHYKSAGRTDGFLAQGLGKIMSKPTEAPAGHSFKNMIGNYDKQHHQTSCANMQIRKKNCIVPILSFIFLRLFPKK